METRTSRRKDVSGEADQTQGDTYTAPADDYDGDPDMDDCRENDLLVLGSSTNVSKEIPLANSINHGMGDCHEDDTQYCFSRQPIVVQQQQQPPRSRLIVQQPNQNLAPPFNVLPMLLRNITPVFADTLVDQFESHFAGYENEYTTGGLKNAITDTLGEFFSKIVEALHGQPPNEDAVNHNVPTVEDRRSQQHDSRQVQGIQRDNYVARGERRPHSADIGTNRPGYRTTQRTIPVSRAKASSDSGEESDDDQPPAHHTARDGTNMSRRLPVFNGKDWKVWRSQFETISRLAGWDTHRKLLELLPKLQGPAGEFVFGQLPTASRTNYKVMIQELEYRFRKVETTRAYAIRFGKRPSRTMLGP